MCTCNPEALRRAVGMFRQVRRPALSGSAYEGSNSEGRPALLLCVLLLLCTFRLVLCDALPACAASSKRPASESVVELQRTELGCRSLHFAAWAQAARECGCVQLLASCSPRPKAVPIIVRWTVNQMMVNIWSLKHFNFNNPIVWDSTMITLITCASLTAAVMTVILH